MKLFVIIILSLILIQGCEAQTALPAEMPENITVSLNLTGAMSRRYIKATIDDGVLEYEELVGGAQEPRKWSARILRADLAKLYSVFVENKFDTIKNDERKGTVYDAGSERISISINKQQSFGVTSGKNSPLSGANLERYEKVSRTLYDLIAVYKNGGSIDADGAVKAAEKFIQGAWRATGTNGGYGWFLEYTFDNGNFKQTGYPAIFQEGKYRVLSSEGDKLTLELYEQKGTFGEENRELVVLIDRKTNGLTISGTKGFTRAAEKKTDQ
jgi:hypothetical protein